MDGSQIVRALTLHTGNLLVLSEKAFEAAGLEAVPYSPAVARDQLSAGDSPVEVKIPKAIDHLLRNRQN